MGDADADRSPVLLPSPPQRLNDLRDSLSMPHLLHFQASSTPVVREVNSVITLYMYFTDLHVFKM